MDIKLKEINFPEDPNRLFDLFLESLSLVDEPTARCGLISRFLIFKSLNSIAETVFFGDGGDELFLGYLPEYWTWDEKIYIKPLIKFPSITKHLTSIFYKTGDLGISKLRVLPACCYKDSLSRYALSAAILDLNVFSKLSKICQIDLSKLLIKKLEPIIRRAKVFSHLSSETLSSKSCLLLFILPYSDVLIDENLARSLNIGIKLPFFDQEVAKLAFSFSKKLKLNGNITRYIVRKMCELRKLIPAKIIWSKRKCGLIQPMSFLESERATEEIKDSLKNFPLNSKAVSLLNQLSYMPRSRNSILTLLTWLKSLKME